MFAAFLAFPTGQGIACLLACGQFVWPGPRLGESLLGLIRGEPGRGLSASMQAAVPPALVVYTVVAVLEAALVAVAIVGFAWWWRTIGPLAQLGMGTKHEVAAVVGRRHLMRRGKTIRPDLIDRGPR